MFKTVHTLFSEMQETMQSQRGTRFDSERRSTFLFPGGIWRGHWKCPMAKEQGQAPDFILRGGVVPGKGLQFEFASQGKSPRYRTIEEPVGSARRLPRAHYAWNC